MCRVVFRARGKKEGRRQEGERGGREERERKRERERERKRRKGEGEREGESVSFPLDSTHCTAPHTTKGILNLFTLLPLLALT